LVDADNARVENTGGKETTGVEITGVESTGNDVSEYGKPIVFYLSQST